MKNVRFIFAVIFKLLPKLRSFKNSDDIIGKITSNYNRLYPVFIEKRFESNKKKELFLAKKIELYRIVLN